MLLKGRAQEAPSCSCIRHYLDDFVRAEDTAPTLLLHGDQDTQVPIAQSEAMIAANPDIRLRRVAGGEHGLWTQSEELWPEVLEFMVRHLAPV
jgi:fermentation-respiration switch protein FrsA (DUF1100 family)